MGDQDDVGARTRVLRADALRNRNKVLAAARVVVQQEGTEASLREIARRAEVGLATLYRHFPRREDLLVALLHDLFGRFAARAAQLGSNQAPEEALAQWLREYLEGAAPYRGFSGTMMGTITDPTSALFAACSAMREAVGVLLRRAQDAGRIRADVDALDVFVVLNAVSWIGDQPPIIAERQDRLLALVLDGLMTASIAARTGSPIAGVPPAR
jgi:AcrR family transcriptional regulator